MILLSDSLVVCIVENVNGCGVMYITFWFAEKA